MTDDDLLADSECAQTGGRFARELDLLEPGLQPWRGVRAGGCKRHAKPEQVARFESLLRWPAQR